MSELKPHYIVDENNRRIAAMVDIDTFEKIEDAIENRGLYLMMKDDDDDESLSLEEAKVYYEELMQENADRV